MAAPGAQCQDATGMQDAQLQLFYQQQQQQLTSIGSGAFARFLPRCQSASGNGEETADSDADYLPAQEEGRAARSSKSKRSEWVPPKATRPCTQDDFKGLTWRCRRSVWAVNIHYSGQVCRCHFLG